MSSTDWKPALRRAVEILGSQAAVGQAIGTSQEHISFLLRKAVRPIDPSYAIALETATAGQVKRNDFRPDIFGDLPDQEAAS